MDYNEGVKQAILAIEQLPRERVFVLKDLFEGCQWNDLPKKDRLNFGRYFKNQVVLGQIENVKYCGKTSNNSAKYMKV